MMVPGTVPYRTDITSKVFILFFWQNVRTYLRMYIISYNYFYGIKLIQYFLLIYVYQYHLILQVDKVIHQTSNISIFVINMEFNMVIIIDLLFFSFPSAHIFHMNTTSMICILCYHFVMIETLCHGAADLNCFIFSWLVICAIENII